MNEQIDIAIAQYDIAWENPEKNRAKIEKLLDKSEGVFDLLVLPEMFTTGFSMNTHVIAESPGGSTCQWMVEIANKYECVVTGSIVVKEKGKFYNRLLWATREGILGHYDKKHLFTLAKEDQHFSSGEKRNIFEIECQDGSSWKICPLICYDVRFPVWSRNNEDYDLLIYVANFPEKRRYAWRQLLIARAIENQCYTIGVNRIGKDGIGIPYAGESIFVSYNGQVMEDALSEEGIFIQSLPKSNLKVFKRAYNFLADRDEFEITT